MSIRATGRFVCTIIVLLGCLVPAVAMAGGPWKGRIVDADTGQPLGGVIVVFYWVTYTASLGGWAGGELHDAEEVVRGPDGAFVILPHHERQSRLERAWKQLEGAGAVIALPPLTTRKERLEFLDLMSILPMLPRDRATRLNAAIDNERLPPAGAR